MSSPQVIQLHAQDGGLQSCLTLARVHEDIQIFLKDVLHMTSLTDFYYYVTKESWEKELEIKILEPAVAAKVVKDTDKPLQLSRLRMAWQSADKVMATTDSVASQASQDEPLPENIRQMLDQRWKSRYGEFVLEPALTASSAIIHRLYREWSLGHQSTVFNLQKMKTALAERFVGEKLQLSLGAATLTLGEAAHASTTTVNFRNLSHFYLIHRCLTNAWSYVGNFEKQSFEDPTKKVLAMSYPQTLSYSDQAALSWVVRNDQLTRSRTTSSADPRLVRLCGKP